MRAWRKFIVTYEAAVLIAAPVEANCASRAAQGDDGSECVIVETPAQLETITQQIPQGFSHAKLRNAVEEGSFLICVRRHSPGGAGKHIVGYRICERAVFRWLGVHKRVSPQFVFIH